MELNIGLHIVQKPSRKTIIWSIIFGVVIGIVAFAPVWLRNGGQYMDYGDGFLQYVPFIKELKRMALSGNLSWSWNSFLGDGFISAYSYYTIFNPFAWIVALFPNNLILYGIMFCTLLKLAVCMVSSLFYIKLFCKKDIYALIGALLYTFSGFTIVNTSFYFFLDIIAVFPLLLYGLELLIWDKKRFVYILSLFINAAMNYYFFVSTVLIIIIYVTFRLELYKPSSWKNQWKCFLDIVLCSFIGTGLAGIALFPSIYAILGSGKAMESIGTKLFQIWPENILEHIRVLLAPIDSGRYHAFFAGSIWSSTAAYLPLFGVYCVLLWCMRKKDWLKKLCITLVVFYMVPTLNASFSLFSSNTYTRWLYIMVLVFSLITARTLEEIETKQQKFNTKVLWVTTVITAALLCVPTAVYILYKYDISLVNRFCSACTTEMFMGYTALITILLLTVLNYAGLWRIVKAKAFNAKMVVCYILVACAANFFVYNELNYDKFDSAYNNAMLYKVAITEGTEETAVNYEYRVDYPDILLNYGLFKNISSVKYYNSIQNPNNSKFAAAVGIADSIRNAHCSTPEFGSEYTDALLSVKYYYDYDGNSDVPDGFIYDRNENGVKIYENSNYIPIGFTYDSYCLDTQLNQMEPCDRAKALLSVLVIAPENENDVKSILVNEFDLDLSFDLAEVSADRRKATCSEFCGTSRGFNAKITLEKENIVFFSIPNDTGWEVKVNGAPADVYEVNYGLMGVRCGVGESVITAVYHTKGLSAGIACSAVSLVVVGAMVIIAKFRKGKKAGR